MANWATSVVWIDANGNKTITRIETFAGFTSFSGALKGCSNADFLQYWESLETNNSSPAPVLDDFVSVADRAALLFLCADNTLVTVLVPSPSIDIFYADGETVNPSSAAISTLITNVAGSLVNGNGSLALSFVAGYRLPRAKLPL